MARRVRVLAVTVLFAAGLTGGCTLWQRQPQRTPPDNPLPVGEASALQARNPGSPYHQTSPQHLTAPDAQAGGGLRGVWYPTLEEPEPENRLPLKEKVENKP